MTTQSSKFITRKAIKLLDPLFIKILVSGFTISSIWLLGLIVYRYLLPHTYIIVAGQKEGESYILSQALKKVVETRFPNIDLEIVETDGTDENLAALEGDLKNKKVTDGTKQALRNAGTEHAHLATAQADVVTDDTVRASGSSEQEVATLYQDTFQLLVKNSESPDFLKFIQRLSSPTKQAVVEAPLRGGQRRSFNKIAEHFNLHEGENYCFRYQGEEDLAKLCKDNTGAEDAIFRVRILGNQEIDNKLQSGKWQLISIEQVEAMKLRHSAFQTNIQIPVGAYRGVPPIPSKSINTIAVPRLLLTRKDVPDWLVYEITAILNQHGQDLVEALKEIATKKGDPNIENYVVPLVNNIPNLNKPDQAVNTGLAIHAGAEKFYSPNESWSFWLINNIGNISAGVSLVLLIASGLWGLNLTFKRERKDKADRYIQEVAFLMGYSSEYSTPPTNGETKEATSGNENRPTDEETQTDKNLLNHEELKGFKQELDEEFKERQEKFKNQIKTKIKTGFDKPPLNVDIYQLVKGVFSLEQLTKIFEKARDSLDREEISQESFRTFNEAYKTARELIERQNEDKQREIASLYVRKITQLLQPNQPINSLEELNKIRNEAAGILTQDYVFSRESFRTFIEAHNLVRDAIEQRQLERI